MVQICTQKGREAYYGQDNSPLAQKSAYIWLQRHVICPNDAYTTIHDRTARGNLRLGPRVRHTIFLVLKSRIAFVDKPLWESPVGENVIIPCLTRLHASRNLVLQQHKRPLMATHATTKARHKYDSLVFRRMFFMFFPWMTWIRSKQRFMHRVDLYLAMLSSVC